MLCRILDLLGAEVRLFDPTGLPIKDDASEAHPKVVELRELSMWSDAHVSLSAISVAITISAISPTPNHKSVVCQKYLPPVGKIRCNHRRQLLGLRS